MRIVALYAAAFVVAGCTGGGSKLGEVEPPPAAAPAPTEQPAARPAPPTRSPPVAARCPSSSDAHLFISPSTPVAGAPLRIIAVTDKPLDAELVARTADGARAASSNVRHGGPPYFWVAEIDDPRSERYTAMLRQRACDEENGASTHVDVSPAAPSTSSSPANGSLWTTRAAWSHELENVYSAWIETLFDAPDREMPTWPALDVALHDRQRNFLFDYLGAGEDSVDAPEFRPDCADLPYFLRAYFAFKLGLPFGVSKCSRGSAGVPPKCEKKILTNEDRSQTNHHDATAMTNVGSFLRQTLARRMVHSGSARVPLDDQSSDYYPVPITWESLRPGTVYADPYGHVLVVVKRVPQNAEHSGVLFAVDGRPDATVARKRFWRGNFLFANGRELGGPGWKRFRPVSEIDGKLARWSDDLIRESPDYGDLSQELATVSSEDFYDAMDDVLSPRPLDPRRAILELITALEEQIRTRVDSVDSGREWLATARAPVAMPELAELFEAKGTWEDYSTPSRDLRLLVALDFAVGFPAHVARRSARYAMPKGKSPEDVEKDLQATLSHELASRSVAYVRSDGSKFTLSLADVLAREAILEVGYNPNDCAESRWGAPPGSDEAQTCVTRAPAAQQRRMEELRVWFHERRRPPRRT